MLSNKAEAYTSDREKQTYTTGADRSLQIVLWTLWTIAVVGMAFWNWWADVAAQRPVDLLGIVINTILAGLVGMLAITLVELWLQPERFLE
jgi:hypothetical protein